MEKPFATFAGPGFVDILVPATPDAVHVPFRVVGPAGGVSIEVFQPDGQIAWSIPRQNF